MEDEYEMLPACLPACVSACLSSFPSVCAKIASGCELRAE